MLEFRKVIISVNVLLARAKKTVTKNSLFQY